MKRKRTGWLGWGGGLRQVTERLPAALTSSHLQCNQWPGDHGQCSATGGCFIGVRHGAKEQGKKDLAWHLGCYRDRAKSRTALCRVEPKKPQGRKLQVGVKRRGLAQERHFRPHHQRVLCAPGQRWPWWERWDGLDQTHLESPRKGWLQLTFGSHIFAYRHTCMCLTVWSYLPHVLLVSLLESLWYLIAILERDLNDQLF